MKKVEFNFNHIPNVAVFYQQFSKKLALDDTFGANLDALWDVITGDISLPIEITFTHLTRSNKHQFDAIIALFQEAAVQLEGDLLFTVRITT